MRTALKVDKDLLLKSVGDVEANGPLENRNKLFSRVADAYNMAKSNDLPQISFSVVSLRLSEYGLLNTLKTPLGKKGRQKVDTSKFDNPKTVLLNAQFIKKETPLKYHPLIERAVTDLYAVIALKCLECAGFEEEEITICGCLGCPNHSFRPFQLEKK